MTDDPGATQAGSDEPPRYDGDERVPARVGRYTVLRVLGRGGMGVVYLARDEDLQRQVAVKVPNHFFLGGDLAAYLTEARAVAALDHPNIVPVYDVGSAAEFPCFIVSKFIEGSSLAEVLAQRRPDREESVRLVAAVAAALDHAHRLKVIHRDIKPGNLLIDRAGVPHVVDFGLAIREEDLAGGARSFDGPVYAGTPAYMSPEQARGEGHRVDRRSDIFSLGSVFYELLVGRRPFAADSVAAVLEQVANTAPLPPRKIDEHVPKELERICLRAMARPVSERYATAAELADDLRHWLQPLSSAGRAEPAPRSAELAARPPEAFISHTSTDAGKAKELCELLEARGVRCWIAPRDIVPGDDYRASIVKAIEVTPVVLLLLSEEANGSVHVAAEIERAVAKRKRVVTLRLEKDVQFGERLELHLSATHWLDAWNTSLYELVSVLVRVFRASTTDFPSVVTDPAALPSSSADDRALIDPKGPRSFDKEDAGYFMRLLPGPRDRDGLPDGARFWKQRVESQERDQTFAVGLVYGPSGCGKSSRVKAALLPRLAKTVIPIYFEATADGTEARLLRELREKLPLLPADLDLPDAMAALRRGQYLPAGHKVTVFLDQFEQWLHTKPEDSGGPLVQALRQCDGVRVQCVIMIREDFWPAVNGFFMRALDIRLVEGVNARRIDLFDPRHARDVLVMFGQAMGALPPNAAAISKDQNAFLDQAIQGLAQDGKVVCVRLSLFAEMVRHKEWSPATLAAVGGIDGIGVTFLDETFTSPNSPPQYRHHQEAAQNVLRELLPPAGSNIKGHMRSVGELLAASGYAAGSGRFEELIRILDGELRLITLTDPGEVKPGTASAVCGPQHYQLTHDYLVPSLREWLGRKQRETRRGRAELLLEDRAAVWGVRREHHLLPSLVQWLQILWHVPRRKRTKVQQRMMRKARRHHAVRIAALVLLLAGLAVAGLNFRNQLKAQSLHDQIIHAEPSAVPALAADGAAHRPRLDPLLRHALAEAEARGDARTRLNASLALLPVDPGQAEYLAARLLDAEPDSVLVLVDALDAHKGPLLDRFWPIAERADAPAGEQLRAAAALAKYDPTSAKWDRLSARVVAQLVRENPVHLGDWSKAFGPVRGKLVGPLQKLLREPLREPPRPAAKGDDAVAAPDALAAERKMDLTAAERAARKSIAANLLLSFAADAPGALAEALLEADENQFPKFFEALRAHKDVSLLHLLREVAGTWAEVADPEEKERQARRVANAGVCLVMFDDVNAVHSVWKLLKWSSDLRVRSYLISRLGRLGASPKALVARLGVEPDVEVRRALVQALGGFPEAAFAPGERAALVAAVQRLYATTDDPGLHASAEWLLREWKHGEWLDREAKNRVASPDRKPAAARVEAACRVAAERPESARCRGGSRPARGTRWSRSPARSRSRSARPHTNWDNSSPRSCTRSGSAARSRSPPN